MKVGITDLSERLRLKIIPSSTKIRTIPSILRPGLVDLNTS